MPKPKSNPIDESNVFGKYTKTELIEALEKVQKSNYEILESLKQIKKWLEKD